MHLAHERLLLCPAENQSEHCKLNGKFNKLLPLLRLLVMHQAFSLAQFQA